MGAEAVGPVGEAGGRGACLNCGIALAGDYCHHCGQPAHIHRTLSAWWHDLAHGVLHLDGKVWRTLPLLAWKPGELTRRYVEGERAKFVSPLALFLFSVFLMFAVFSAMGATAIAVDPAGVEQGVAEEVKTGEAKLALLRRERQAEAAAGRPVEVLDQRIKKVEEDLSLLRTMRDQGLVRGTSVRLSDDVPDWLRKPLEKAGKNPSLFFYKVQTNAYKFSWSLIPISLPFLWLLFLHRRRYRERYKAYDHLIFVTYSIAFMSLLLIGFVLLRTIGIGGGLVTLLFLLVPPVHMYRQLRGAYALSRWSAGWRAFILLNFTAAALTIFLLLLIALGVFG